MGAWSAFSSCESPPSPPPPTLGQLFKASCQKSLLILNALYCIADAKLHLFGSSCNGFGFSGSDMDLCMTLKGKKKSDIDCVDYITKLASILRKNPECSNILAITGAKVPIVKFILKHANVEADISMYNEVALWNTSLLRTYVDIDSRVHVLGCTLKIFVKVSVCILLYMPVVQCLCN